MTPNQELNNTCILFDKDNEAQQKAIIKFYNDNGWYNHNMNKHSYDTCIGVRFRDLDYWQNSPQRMRIIDLPKEYYPIDIPINIHREIADQYQGLFNLMSKEHDLTLTISEMDEIIIEVQKFLKNANNKSNY